MTILARRLAGGFNLHAFGHNMHDRVGEAELQVELIALSLSTETNAHERELLSKPTVTPLFISLTRARIVPMLALDSRESSAA